MIGTGDRRYRPSPRVRSTSWRRHPGGPRFRPCGLPPQDVRVDLLERSETLSKCPYKGDGQHWNLTVGENTVQDAAWTLPDPLAQIGIVPTRRRYYDWL